MVIIIEMVEKKKDTDFRGPHLERLNNGQYGYMNFPGDDNDRRRLLINNEIKILKNQINQLKLKHITTKKDLLYFSFALILASIFGSISFITLMNIKGYKLTYNKKYILNRSIKDQESLIN